MVTNTTLVTTPRKWLNTVEYPFAPHVFDSEDGQMSYVDVGRGRPILFLHGSPTWSFLYRKLIKELSATHRCIAVDHLGLGLSEKPRDADYRPAAHTRRLNALVDSLGIEDVTVVGHDFGGSIALDWAGQHPSRVRDMVQMNTWLWSLCKLPVIRRATHTATSPINQYWFRLLNPSPKFYLPILFADHHRLSKWVQDQYQHAFNNQFETYCPEALARAMTSRDDWYASVTLRLPNVSSKPCLILWGEEDVTYGLDALPRLKSLLPNAADVVLKGVGNYVPEEAPELCVQHISRFIG